MKRTMIAVFCVFTAVSLSASMYIQSAEYYTQTTYSSYTGFDLAQYITVSHNGDAEDFFLTFSGGGSNSTDDRMLTTWDGKEAHYQLYDSPSSRRILRELKDIPSSNEVLSGHFSAGSGSSTVEYYFSKPAGDFPSGGYLSDTITITLYSGTVASYEKVQEINVGLALQVQSEAAVSVVPTGGSFDSGQTAQTLDFGVLSTGLERRSDIIVRSNVHYTLGLTSTNGSVLKRTDQWEDSEIPYSITVNGAPVSLIAYQNVTIAEEDKSDSDGSRYAVSVVIGDFWGVSSGTFGDTIQVTLMAW